MNIKRIIIVSCALVFSYSVTAGNRLIVYAVNYPLTYFAERIGGDYVDVKFPVPKDIDPAFWVPDTETIGRYQRADLILLNGAGYAKWTSKVALPRSRSVNTSATFTEDYIQVKDTVTHTHGPKGEHAHTGFAFTTWLDFQQAIAQAGAIKHALVKKLPQHKKYFEQNYQSLEADLLALDAALAKTVKGKHEMDLLASHPVYQYMARRYDLNIKAVNWEPDVFPEPQQWFVFEQLQDTHGGGAMLWEAEPLIKTAQKLAEHDIVILVFDPGANLPEKGDFISVMRSNIQNLTTVFSN